MAFCMDSSESAKSPAFGDGVVSSDSYEFLSLPPTGVTVEFLKTCGVSETFGECRDDMFDTIQFVHPNDNVELPHHHLFERLGLDYYLGDDEIDTLMHDLFLLSKSHLVALATELFATMCATLSMCQRDSSGKTKTLIPKRVALDSIRAQQAIFSHFLRKGEKLEELKRLEKEFLSWNQDHLEDDPAHSAARQWASDHGTIFRFFTMLHTPESRSTQTVDPSHDDLDESKSLSPIVETETPRQPPSPPTSNELPNTTTPSISDNTSAAEVTPAKKVSIASRVQRSPVDNSPATRSNSQSQSATTSAKHDSPPHGVLRSVFNSPTSDPTPDLIFTRVRNAHDVSEFKLFNHWDGILNEVFGNESVPESFQSSNIRRISLVGHSGVSVTLKKKPSDDVLEHFFEKCKDETGQLVLQNIFDTWSTIGASKFDPNFVRSPPRRVGKSFSSQRSREQSRRPRKFYFENSPIRPPNFTQREENSPHFRRGQRKFDRSPQWRGKVMPSGPRAAPPTINLTFQIQALQQQMQSILQFQQQTAQFLQHLGHQLF